VKVKFFYYAGSMQEACVRLMGKKLLVSLAMEGKFASEGLQATDEGDDILMAMARELVTEKGIGESADAVWKTLQKQRAEVFGGRTVETSAPRDEAEVLAENLAGAIIPPPVPEVVTQFLMFESTLEPIPKRKPPRRTTAVSTSSSQLGLF
jgi:hypothetical protein